MKEDVNAIRFPSRSSLPGTRSVLSSLHMHRKNNGRFNVRSFVGGVSHLGGGIAAEARHNDGRVLQSFSCIFFR